MNTECNECTSWPCILGTPSAEAERSTSSNVERWICIKQLIVEIASSRPCAAAEGPSMGGVRAAFAPLDDEIIDLDSQDFGNDFGCKIPTRKQVLARHLRHLTWGLASH